MMIANRKRNVRHFWILMAVWAYAACGSDEVQRIGVSSATVQTGYVAEKLADNRVVARQAGEPGPVVVEVSCFCNGDGACDIRVTGQVVTCQKGTCSSPDVPARQLCQLVATVKPGTDWRAVLLTP